jgi:hypothetical protein
MLKLKLTEWASIAEIISAIAVVGSLFYVGYQIKQNTEVSLAANRQSIATRAQELALYSAEVGIHKLLFATETDSSQLSSVERNRLIAYIGALLRTTEEAFLLYRDKMLDEEYWITRANVLLTMLKSTKTREIYYQTKNSGFYTKAFSGWVDNALNEKYGI